MRHQGTMQRCNRLPGRQPHGWCAGFCRARIHHAPAGARSAARSPCARWQSRRSCPAPAPPRRLASKQQHKWSFSSEAEAGMHAGACRTRCIMATTPGSMATHDCVLRSTGQPAHRGQKRPAVPARHQSRTWSCTFNREHSTGKPCRYQRARQAAPAAWAGGPRQRASSVRPRRAPQQLAGASIQEEDRGVLAADQHAAIGGGHRAQVDKLRHAHGQPLQKKGKQQAICSGAMT